jgi:hypothetical protein
MVKITRHQFKKSMYICLIPEDAEGYIEFSEGSVYVIHEVAAGAEVYLILGSRWNTPGKEPFMPSIKLVKRCKSMEEAETAILLKTAAEAL